MIVRMMLFAALTAVLATGCAARSAQLAVVSVRLTETPAEEAPRERLNQKLAFNVTLIGDAGLLHQKPAELLHAAEGKFGGDPQKLMRAARTLIPADGVVLLGTVRSQESGGGSATSVISYQLALGCGPANLDGPGDLKDCRGYLLRVSRTWPAEVYEIDSATVSLIPEGGTVSGRLRARSVPGGFKAELEGAFAGSLVELSRASGVAAAAEP